MRSRKTFENFLLLKFKTLIYSKDELLKHKILCSDVKLVNKLNVMFEADGSNFRLVKNKDNIYTLEEIV